MSKASRERKLAAAWRLSRTVRRAFRGLGQAVDRLHSERGVTAAMRVVLEMVSEQGPMTVPQMARQKGLSRQHFQVKVDRLLAAGLVRTEPNPAHARSPLVALTGEGRATFAAMREREDELLASAVQGLPAEDIERAERLLDAMTTALGRIEEEEKSDDQDD